MVNATSFTYEGIDSKSMDLYIRQFDASTVEENVIFTRDVQTIKAPALRRWFSTSADLGEPPTLEFSIISQLPLTSDAIRYVMRWLSGSTQFKRIEFHTQESIGDTFYIYGIFSSVSCIYVNGRCVGFNLTCVTDSPYARGIPTIVKASCTANTQKTVVVRNNSDIINDYVYPKITFGGTGITVINTTDSATRAFTFAGLSSGGLVTVDNEIKQITSSVDALPLQKFTSKKWLRLLPGTNVLSITTTTTTNVTIECPCYVLFKH